MQTNGENYQQMVGILVKHSVLKDICQWYATSVAPFINMV